MTLLVSETKPIQLKYDEDTRVVVHHADGDRVVVSAAEAVLSILKWGSVTTRLSDVQEQMHLLLRQLRTWCDTRASRIYRAFVQVNITYERVGFIVIQKAVPYDEQLSDDLTELDLELFHHPQLGAIRVDVLGIPRCSLDSMQAFVNLDKSICIAEYADA
jgi:hypothetical protein